MHQYHAHAKLVRNETERLLQRATAKDDSRRPSQPVPTLEGGPIDASFVIREGALEAKDGSVFETKPSEMLRIFQVAIAHDLTLSLRTREILAELAVSHAEALRKDPESGPCFVEILCDQRDRANPSRLEQMQDLGLLAAMMPEWEPSTGRVQHDIYHVYTVDQHALYAIGRLHALARGDHADQFPLPTETVRSVHRPVALAAGTLLHDVGKPYGSPHSEIGAGLAVDICRRLGIEEDDIRRVEFLVRQHLVMGQMSQRRDLDDISMISDFATLCGDEENLRELYLLTFCDLSSVAPDAMSSWKETLLGELYSRTLAFFRRGPDLLGAERAEIVLRRQKRAAAILEEPENAPALATLFGGFPDRYFADNSALRIANHVRLMRARRKGGKHAMIDVDHHERLGVTEMVLAARDVPGLLAEVAGVLYANRVEVLDAAIYTRHPAETIAVPNDEPEALDIFRVRDAMGRAVTDEGRWKKVREDLESVLSGRLTGEALVASRPRGESVAAWRTPAVPTELKIDNDVSRDFTRARGRDRGSPRYPVRDQPHAVHRGAGHPPLEDRDRGQPRHRRLLRARQGDAGEDHRPGPTGAAAKEAFGASGAQIDCRDERACPPGLPVVLAAGRRRPRRRGVLAGKGRAPVPRRRRGRRAVGVHGGRRRRSARRAAALSEGGRPREEGGRRRRRRRVQARHPAAAADGRGAQQPGRDPDRPGRRRRAPPPSWRPRCAPNRTTRRRSTTWASRATRRGARRTRWPPTSRRSG